MPEPGRDAHDNDHAIHMLIERFERGWMIFALALLVVFTVLVFHAILTVGEQIARTEERRPVSAIMAEERFTQPGVQRVGANAFEVNVVAQSFAFIPDEVRLPVGAEATFFVASRDVIHGYQVMGTTINFEIIPGEVAIFSYTFDEPGRYRVVCNQYCGIGHHNMLAWIVVESEEVFAAREDELLAEADPDEDETFDWQARGEAAYANCAACHQANGRGIPGAFPPLAGHMPDLVAREGGREYLIEVVLYGLQGPITVLGNRYDALMPGFGYLSDVDVASLLNYALHAWENDELLPEDFEAITPEEVAAQRGQGLSPSDVHTAREALGLD
jgi:cytochrome c oxidase subunit 2